MKAQNIIVLASEGAGAAASGGARVNFVFSAPVAKSFVCGGSARGFSQARLKCHCENLPESHGGLKVQEGLAQGRTKLDIGGDQNPKV